MNQVYIVSSIFTIPELTKISSNVTLNVAVGLNPIAVSVTLQPAVPETGEIITAHNPIQNSSEASWKEMFQVFNMGSRMEIMTDKNTPEEILKISKSFGVEGKIIGHCEKTEGLEGKNKLVIKSEYGTFDYIK